MNEAVLAPRPPRRTGLRTIKESGAQYAVTARMGRRPRPLRSRGHSPILDRRSPLGTGWTFRGVPAV